MPFDLRNATQTFQRFINTVLQELRYCHGYIDDVLVASRNEDEYRAHLEKIFQRFRKYGLSINITKSKFGEKEVDYRDTQWTSMEFDLLKIESTHFQQTLRN